MCVTVWLDMLDSQATQCIDTSLDDQGDIALVLSCASLASSFQKKQNDVFSLFSLFFPFLFSLFFPAPRRSSAHFVCLVDVVHR